MSDSMTPTPAAPASAADPFAHYRGIGTPHPLIGLYRLLLREQLTRGRVLLTGVMSALAILVTALIAREGGPFQIDDAIGFLWFFGLGLSVPIISLVLASSSLGQLVEDETLVYLWIRPTPRWMLALAAWLAPATVAVPFTAVPLAVAAFVGTSGDLGHTWAVGVSVVLAALAYTAIFTLLGLLVRRSLIWGMLYLFIWELFVARVGEGAARLSINTYPSSVLSRMTDVDLPRAERLMSAGIIVPLVVAAVAVALTAWRLDRSTVA
ncbi:MAG: hypothetical protein AAF962_02220 [Actinomycetota bacterium]